PGGPDRAAACDGPGPRSPRTAPPRTAAPPRRTVAPGPTGPDTRWSGRGPSGRRRCWTETWPPSWHPVARSDHGEAGASEAQPVQVLGIALPVLQHLDPEVQVHRGPQQRLDLAAGGGA